MYRGLDITVCRAPCVHDVGREVHSGDRVIGMDVTLELGPPVPCPVAGKLLIIDVDPVAVTDGK
jgi:hypothetical protein